MRVSVTIDGREIRGRAWTGKHREADVGMMYVKEDGREHAADLVFATIVSHFSFHSMRPRLTQDSLKFRMREMPNLPEMISILSAKFNSLFSMESISDLVRTMIGLDQSLLQRSVLFTKRNSSKLKFIRVAITLRGVQLINIRMSSTIK